MEKAPAQPGESSEFLNSPEAAQNGESIKMLHVALWRPQIPPNTGNIARLCAATSTRLHLIGQLGFQTDEKAVRRAGLDYWPHVDWVHHSQETDFWTWLGRRRIWLIDNPASQNCYQVTFAADDVLLFGNEPDGLPETLKEQYQNFLLEIPMLSGKVRSINLATAAGIVLYEALRQIHGWSESSQ